MRHWKISPSNLSGTIVIPPSKSQSIRALLFALMAKGKSALHNLLPSPDVEHMILACEHLGAKVERFSDRVEIVGVNGVLKESEDVIFCGNSGLVLRFIGALGGLSLSPLVLTGDYSVRHNREVSPLLEALSQVGCTAFSLRKDGGAPIFVKGPFRAHTATFSGKDSQPVSAMLFAASFAPFPVELFVTDPGEKPWVNLTLNWLDRVGISYVANNFEHYKLKGNASIESFSYKVAGDYSSSAFPIAAALLTKSEITIENLDPKDPQGDQKLIPVLQKMGAQIEIDEQKCSLRVKKSGALQGIKIDVNEFIDALPILAVLGCFAEGEMHLSGGQIARKKECDRISCIANELKKMGASIEEKEDGLIIKRSFLKGADVESHHDHRLALSLAVAALGAKGDTLIRETGCASKSYPHFFSHFQHLGAQINGVS